MMTSKKTRSPLLEVRAIQQCFERKLLTATAAFLTQKCNLPTRTIKFEIWDTAGQERFASLAPMYYRNAQSALVVYDLTKPASLTKAKHWVAELQRQASPGIVIALVGNKMDLEERKITTEEGQSYAEEESLLFFETSAKTGENVSEVFEAIASGIPESTLKGPKPKVGGDGEARVNLNAARDAGAKEGCAC